MKKSKPLTTQVLWIIHFILLGVIPFYGFLYFLFFNLKIIDISKIKSTGDYKPLIIFSAVSLFLGFIVPLIIRKGKNPHPGLVDDKTFNRNKMLGSALVGDFLFESIGIMGFVMGFLKAPSFVSYLLIGISFALIAFNTMIVKSMTESLEKI